MKRYIAWLLLVLFLAAFGRNAAAEQKVVSILHVNDFHGFAEPYRPFGSEDFLGGIAALAFEVDRIRAQGPTLLVSAGDMIQGNNWANLFFGESVVELMNEMRFDAMALGNHEFDFGLDVLRKRISEAQFPVLGANVEGLDLIRPYVVKEIQGVRIAFIGLVTEDVPVTTHPRNVPGLSFLPVVSSVEKNLELLRGKADIVIVLSHIGHAADRDLAAKVTGLTAIIGGHSHTRVLQPVVINNTIVLQAWEHGKALGRLDLYVEDLKVVRAEGRLIDIRPLPETPDTAVTRLVKKYSERVDARLDEPVGEALVDLDGENVRSRETNLGNFITDIIRKTAMTDAAIIGGGSIRTSIKKGKILMKHVYAVSPFNNYVVGVRLTGRQIREALEHGLSAIEDGAGRFPQVSGMSFAYSRTAAVGARIRDLTIAGRPAEADREYTVATDDFLAAGGDGYKAFGEAVRSSKDFTNVGGTLKGEKLVYSNSGKWERDVIIDYIREVKQVSPVVEGRIREVKD
ncbi:MAG: multifunctional 2',3'-cyclic-nucleotide 2'-phosphodiesterase/5'-nucleotidase/3'-nucleotidase [Thermodesulfovibrio sp.]|nr:multifunctional 2',3'-cyclic-nucleotide 2'-phosphodiesterase/5'-nucleotidase/3'-nucleotidase [Thermodesulfovibrio sp.]